MGEMRDVVQDMLDRLEVDLTGDELVQLLATFNLTAWGGEIAKQKDIRISIISLAERLSEILGWW